MTFPPAADLDVDILAATACANADTGKDHATVHNALATFLNDFRALLTTNGDIPTYNGTAWTRTTRNTLAADRAFGGNINVEHYATVADAVADLADGDTLFFPPKAAVYTASTELNIPSGVDINGYGATLRFSASAGRIRLDNAQKMVFQGLSINGNNVATLPLKIGTTAGGDGAKSVFRDVSIQSPAVGGTGCEIQNLQNSSFYDFRLVDCDNATTGLLIDNGSKNIDFFSLWASSVNGPNLKVTTTAGSQKTSKIRVFGALMENGTGIQLEECESFKLYGGTINAPQGGATNGILLSRIGVTPAAPSKCYISDCQIKGFTNAFHLTAAMNLQVGACELAESTNQYKVEHASARIVEMAPHTSLSSTRFVSVVGAVEDLVVSPTGYVVTTKTAAPADGSLTAGQMTCWFDSTAGAAKLMVKGKNASGTVVTGSLALS